MTHTSRQTKLHALSACSQILQLARVGVRVLIVDVVCVMFVLIAHVDAVRAVYTVFVSIFCSKRCTLFTSRR